MADESGPASPSAVVLLHEIYGINRHMVDVSARLSARGYDVFCPNLLGRPTFAAIDGETAYAYFMQNVGFGIAAAVTDRIAGLRPLYERVFLVGYSVGATIAWRAAASAACDGIVCHYGTRIRDYAEAVPACPALLILAEDDAAFPPGNVRKCFAGAANVRMESFPGEHGFCNPYGKTYGAASARRADTAAADFLEAIRRVPGNRQG